MSVLATYPVAPTVTPRTGTLLDVASVSDNFAWLDGNDLFDSYNCMKFDAEAAFCAPNSKSFNNKPAWQDGILFAAYGGVVCKAIGLDQSRMLSETERVFTSGESTAVERALMKYRFAAKANHWAAPTDLTPTGGAVKPAVGVALLEGYAGANYVGAPTLHLPLTVASLMLGATGVLVQEGDSIGTKLGSKVAAGSGYDFPNLGPTGSAAPTGEKWLYATGEVVIVRGEVVMRQAMDYSTNEVFVLAERPYVAAVDCFTAAVRVQVTA